MPIQEILPDGKVRIYNKKTGEIKDVSPEELGSYNPALTIDYQNRLRYSEAASEGLIDPKTALEKGVEPTKIVKPKSAEKLKQESKMQDLSKSIDLLEKNLSETEARGRGKGDIMSLLSKVSGGAVAPEIGDYEALRKSLIGPLARTISQEAGVLTDKDISRAEGLLPKITDSAQLTRNKIANLRTLIGERGGPKFIPQQNQKKNEEEISTNGVVDQTRSILGNVAKSAGGVAGGALNFLFTQNVKQYQQAFQSFDPNVSQEQKLQNLQDIQRRTPKAGLELLSYLRPALKGFKGASLAGGALVGGLNETSKDTSTFPSVGKAALGGATVGGILGMGGAALSGIKKSAPKFINQLFKPTQAVLNEFRRNTGLDFAKEVIKRDLPAIKGKGGEEVLEYYTNKVSQFDDAADKFLSNVGRKVDRKELLDIVNKHSGGLKPELGRVLQGSGRELLDELQNEIAKLPDKVDLSVANQIKRDIQTRAQAAFGPSGSSSPASNALKVVQREINNLLEKKAPGVKDVNKSIQFYRLAKDSIQKQLDQASRREGVGLLDILGGGGSAAAFAAGRPEIGAAIAVPTILRRIMQQPQVKSQAANIANKTPQGVLPEFLRKILQIQGGQGATSF